MLKPIYEKESCPYFTHLIQTRQEDGGYKNNENSVNVEDIDVSYAYELDLCVILEPTSLEEVVACDEWK